METGFFNSANSNTIRVFNKPCGIDEWRGAEKPSFLYFSVTEIVDGKCIQVDYKEAFQASYNKLSDEERDIQTAQLKALPNFDADVFFEISGIRV